MRARYACRIRRGSDNRKSAGHERTPERHVARSDQQSLFETGRVGDDDIEVAGGSRMNDLSGWFDDHAHRDWRMEGIEERECA